MNLQEDDSSNRPCSQDYFSFRRNLKELPRLKDDDSGYVEGKVFMTWPPRNKLHRVNLEVLEGSALYRFELEVPYREEITFRPHERVRFALKGVRVDRRKDSSAPYYFPIVLRFPDGVILKYLSGANAGRVVDTWAECTGGTDEWYRPSLVHTVSDVVTSDASKIHHGPLQTMTHPSVSTSPQGDAVSSRGEGVNVTPPGSITVANSAIRLMRPAQQSSIEESGRSLTRRARKKRRLHKEKESTFLNPPANDVGLPPVEIYTEQNQTSVKDYHASGSCLALRQVDGHTNGKAAIQEDGQIDSPRKDTRGNTMIIHEDAGIPALRLKAGVCTQRGDIFTALGDLTKGNSMINVIGIVASVTPEKKTSTNAWSRSFVLVDPSTVDAIQQRITVNCFQKKYLEWLPQVRKDDIVILRKLKVVEFNGHVSATGYSDKLRWAVYDLFKHSIRTPDKGDAPEKESVDDGMGYEFSPYWEPLQDSTEIDYCRKIGEWWKAKRELEGQNVYTVEFSGAPGKQHLLISEASPDLPPGGFFNCTVEVIQKYNNQGGATTVYVTDYTANASVHSVQATWCPPELSDRVLQCAMWDDAKNVAKMMNPGEYWYLHNVRARWNPGHYMEGTMQRAEKITQLDETKLEVQPHLKALLVRKKEFELNKPCLMSGSASLRIFPEMLLQDVEGSTSFLTCIVELLHVELNSPDGHFIYVTDYTYNPDLPTTVATASWACNLQHRVVKIKLDDTQAKISSSLTSGFTYIIHNLRIKRLDISGGMHGCLGGENTLIVSLCDSSGHHAQTLQRNKEKWKRENMLNAPVMLPNGLCGQAHELLKQSSTVSDKTTLQEVVAKPSPNIFRVLARVMDFFPFSLEDACVLRCTKCESSPPPSFKQCPRCDDMMETHCKWFFRLYILLQDEKGDELIVALPGKECTVLQDIDPTDFHSDYASFRKFLAKLDPVLGNLKEVHTAWSKNEHKVIQSPLMVFTVESWGIGDERRYGLLDCIPT